VEDPHPKTSAIHRFPGAAAGAMNRQMASFRSHDPRWPFRPATRGLIEAARCATPLQPLSAQGIASSSEDVTGYPRRARWQSAPVWAVILPGIQPAPVIVWPDTSSPADHVWSRYVIVTSAACAVRYQYAWFQRR
jgi:hypothetical protein